MSQTNAAQLKLMIEFMEQYDALAKNSLQNVSNGREKKKKLWSKLTDMLNSNGPPKKLTKGWQKVWTDYKYNAKRKLSSRMNSLKKTGGGPYDAVQLSNLEERVIAAAQISAHVTGIPGVASYGCNTDEPCSSSAAPQPDEAFVSEYLADLLGEDKSSSNDENKAPSEIEPSTAKRRLEIASDNEAPQTPKAKRRCADPKFKIIEEEIENQRKFQTEILKVLREGNEIQQRKVQLMEMQITSAIQYKKMKLQVLQLDLQKVNCEIALLKGKTNDK